MNIWKLVPLLLVLLTQAAWSAHARGRVVGPDPAYSGAYRVTFPHASGLRKTDNVLIWRNGAVVSRGVVLDAKGDVAVVMPKDVAPMKDDVVTVDLSSPPASPYESVRSSIYPQGAFPNVGFPVMVPPSR